MEDSSLQNIPVIDISDVSLIHVDVGNCRYKELGEKLQKAFSVWGFAYLSNHGIPEDIIQDCIQSGSDFFNLSEDVKLKYSRGIEEIHGYSSVGREILQNKSVVEAKESFDVQNLRDRSKYPDKEVPKFHQSVHYLVHQSVILARRVLRSLAEDLGLENPLQFLENHSEMFAKGNATSLRLLHYPPLKELEGSHSGPSTKTSITRCGVHTDYGGLTMLFQDESGGLEIQKLDGEWIEATPIKNTIVVNIGDLLEYWSNKRYRATPHRVVIKNNEVALHSRYSVALFVHPNHDVDVNPIGQSENVTTEQTATKITAKDHVNKRFNETYDDAQNG